MEQTNNITDRSTVEKDIDYVFDTFAAQTSAAEQDAIRDNVVYLTYSPDKKECIVYQEPPLYAEHVLELTEEDALPTPVDLIQKVHAFVAAHYVSPVFDPSQVCGRVVAELKTATKKRLGTTANKNVFEAYKPESYFLNAGIYYNSASLFYLTENILSCFIILFLNNPYLIFTIDRKIKDFKDLIYFYLKQSGHKIFELSSFDELVNKEVDLLFVHMDLNGYSSRVQVLEFYYLGGTGDIYRVSLKNKKDFNTVHNRYFILHSEYRGTVTKVSFFRRTFFGTLDLQYFRKAYPHIHLHKDCDIGFDMLSVDPAAITKYLEHKLDQVYDRPQFLEKWIAECFQQVRLGNFLENLGRTFQNVSCKKVTKWSGVFRLEHRTQAHKKNIYLPVILKRFVESFLNALVTKCKEREILCLDLAATVQQGQLVSCLLRDSLFNRKVFSAMSAARSVPVFELKGLNYEKGVLALTKKTKEDFQLEFLVDWLAFSYLKNMQVQQYACNLLYRCIGTVQKNQLEKVYGKDQKLHPPFTDLMLFPSLQTSVCYRADSLLHGLFINSGDWTRAKLNHAIFNAFSEKECSEKFFKSVGFFTEKSFKLYFNKSPLHHFFFCYYYQYGMLDSISRLQPGVVTKDITDKRIRLILSRPFPSSSVELSADSLFAENMLTTLKEIRAFIPDLQIKGNAPADPVTAEALKKVPWEALQLRLWQEVFSHHESFVSFFSKKGIGKARMRPECFDRDLPAASPFQVGLGGVRRVCYCGVS